MKLYKYQQEGVDRSLWNNRLLLADEMGLGKTPQALFLLKERNAYPAIIICPAVLKLNWQRECEKWIGKEAFIDEYRGDICITNYERMDRLVESGFHRKAQHIIFDESHMIKNPRSKRGRLAREIAKPIQWKICITGTPMPNAPQELVNQLEVLNRIEEIGGVNRFLNRYCNPRKQPWGTSYKGYSYLAELNQIIKGQWLRRTKKEVEIDLPPVQECFVPLLSMPQPNPTSLQEIEQMDRAVLTQKLPKVKDWIDNFIVSGEKLVLFTHHRAVMERLLNEYPGSSYIVGGQNLVHRQHLIDNFQQRDTQLIICSLTASAVGLTLTAASHCAFVEFPWSPDMLEQAKARIHRISQVNPCTVYYLYAKGSIDEYRLNTIRDKNIMIDIVQR